MIGNHRSNRSRILLTLICPLLVITLLPLLAQAAPPALLPPPPPPPPTLTPASQSQREAVHGAWIALRVQEKVWSTFSWQDLWTVVQWQDAQQGWHDVEGWQGELDEVTAGVGSKVWWVAKSDFGTGPFRWIVRRASTGEQLGDSDPFNLPGTPGETLGIRVTIAP